jgi:hypothetical protein
LNHDTDGNARGRREFLPVAARAPVRADDRRQAYLRRRRSESLPRLKVERAIPALFGVLFGSDPFCRRWHPNGTVAVRRHEVALGGEIGSATGGAAVWALH